MKKTILAILLCGLLWAGALNVTAADAIPQDTLSISFRENTYFIDSAGTLWHNLSSDYDAALADSHAHPPERVMEHVKAVKGIDWVTMALDTASQLWAWGGLNVGNQGYAGFSAHPVVILDQVEDFDLDYRISLAIRQDGTLWAWGDVNTGDSRNQHRPAQVMEKIKAISASGWGWAIDMDDTLWTWTADWDDDADRYAFTPQRVMENVAAAIGTMVIDKAGVLWRMEGDGPESLEAVRVMEEAAEAAPSGVHHPEQGYAIRDIRGGLWVLSKEGKPEQIAGDCRRLVRAEALTGVYYINDKNALCRVDLSGGKVVATLLEPDVAFAKSGCDYAMPCVKTDGSLVIHWSSLGDAEGPRRTVVCTDMLMEAAPGTAPGLPLDPEYVPPIPPVTGFDDIGDSWAREAVLRWAGYGVLQGSGGLFRPEDTITRAEFAAVLNRVMSLDGYTQDTFTDVPEEAWYRRDIIAAYGSGILQGDGRGSLRPLDNITHEEAVVMLARAFRLEYPGEPGEGFAGVSDWAASAVWGMRAEGYLPLRGGEYDFDAKADITRAGVAALLDRLVALYIPEHGYYGGMEEAQVVRGNVVIGTDEVSLRNMRVEGNIYLTPGMGGHVTEVLLREVEVQGTIYVTGHMQSLTLRDSRVERLVADNSSLTGVKAVGKTEVLSITLHSLGRLGESELAQGAGGFHHVEIAADYSSGMTVALRGDFDRLVNYAPGVEIMITGTVEAYYPVAPAKLSGEYTIGKTHADGVLPPELE